MESCELRRILIFSLFLCSKAFAQDSYDLKISSDTPIAEGTSITFNVTLELDQKTAPKGKYRFRYIFDGNEKLILSTDPSLQFTVHTEDLKHGHYSIEIAADVLVMNWFYLEKVRKRSNFDVTNMFNGLMQLTQGENNTIRENGYVSSLNATVHNIIIADKDKSLYDKAAYIRVYWFINCLFVGMTDTLNYSSWYQNENGVYNVEALLMLSYDPLPTPTSTTTTTPKPTTTTPTTTTSTTPTTTTSSTTTSTTSTTPTTTTPTTTSSTTSTTTKKPSKRKRDVSTVPPFEWNVKSLVEQGLIRPENIAIENMTEPTIVTTTQIPMEERIKLLKDFNIPYFGICTNDTKVVTDPKKIYGYYQRTIRVENPVGNVTVENTPWLSHSDMCRLKVRYTGTSPFQYCVTIQAVDNSSTSVASNDCRDWREIDLKEINFSRFLPKTSNSYTVTIFVKNEVSQVRKPIGVKFYEETPKSQLSVIIVPIVFTLMAVVLIVFGVAYYMQNRNQFNIEVADFNFGETASVDSLEYKTFLQRLLDSISDLFIRQDLNEDPDSPGGSGEISNQRYNTMS